MHLKKITAMLLSAALVLSAWQTVPAETTENTPKEEVVYVNLQTDGSVQDIHVVNIFTLEQKARITDYGDYESVRNMTGTETIECEKDAVTIDAEAGTLYYEGTLSRLQIPWDISIRYFLNGKETAAQALAGKDGALKIQLDIQQNKGSDDSFFAHDALQISLALDRDKCSNITAEGATIANAGGSKQLTFTVLPGRGASLTVTTDVKDFAMDGISINALPLQLQLDVDDKNLTEPLTQLSGAIQALDDGADALHTGLSELQRLTQADLQSGTGRLFQGAGELHSGISELKNGGTAFQNGTLTLKNAGTALDDGVQDLNAGIVQMQQSLEQLNAQSPALRNGSAAVQTALTALQAALGSVSLTADDLTALTDASAGIKTGIDTLAGGLAALQENAGSAAWKARMAQNGLDIAALQQNNAEAIATLQTTVDTLSAQMAALQAAGMDTSALQAQIAQQNGLITLLKANTAAIDGAGTYLDELQKNMAPLLQGVKTLQQSDAVFDEKIGTLTAGLSELLHQTAALSSAVAALVDQYSTLNDGILAYTDAVAQLVSGCGQIADGAAQLSSGSSQLKTGTETLSQESGQLLSGITRLYTGSGDLTSGSGTLQQGVSRLTAGVDQLARGSETMKTGTKKLREETAGIDQKVEEQIGRLLDSITGGEYRPVSFVSEKNTQVKSVQFVIKTAAIHPSETAESKTEPAKHLNFWQKLLQLFGLYK